MLVFKKYSLLPRTIAIVLISLSQSSCFLLDDDDASSTPQNVDLGVDVDITVSYEYDSLNRVTKATYSNGKTVLYVYDQAGNIVQKNVQ